MADEGKIILTTSEYDSRMTTNTKVSFGTGIALVGICLLFDKKIEKTTSYAIIVVGALAIGIGVAFRKIDKEDKPSEKKLGVDSSNEKSSNMAISPVYGGYGNMDCYAKNAKGKFVTANCGFELDL